MEDAGKSDNMEIIAQKLPALHKDLAAITDNIEAYLEIGQYDPLGTAKMLLRVMRGGANGESKPDLCENPTELLTKLKQALEQNNITEIDALLAEAEQHKFSESIKKLCAEISNHVLLAEYDKAALALAAVL
jgi:hypothetical protein